MKPFHFTLEAVRTVREREEHQTLRDYVTALRALEEAKRAAAAVDHALGRAWDELRRAIQGNATSLEISRVQDYSEMLLLQKRERDAALHLARQRTNRAFARYLAAHQACAVVEKCFEHQKHRHHRAQARHEQKRTDELAQRGLSLASLIRQTRGTLWN